MSLIRVLLKYQNTDDPAGNRIGLCVFVRRVVVTACPGPKNYVIGYTYCCKAA